MENLFCEIYFDVLLLKILIRLLSTSSYADVSETTTLRSGGGWGEREAVGWP